MTRRRARTRDHTARAFAGALAGLTAWAAPTPADARPPQVRADEEQRERAQSSEDPVRSVILLPLESEGLAPADHARLDASLRAAFEHPEVELLGAALRRECPDADCLRAFGRRQGASHVVRVELSADGRDYAGQIEILAVDGDEPPTTLDASCMICGLVELDDRLAARAISAREQILEGSRTGRLRVLGGPSHARVSIDGLLLGRLPYEGELTAGEHELVVEAAGHAREVITLATVPGDEEIVEVELDPKPVPRWRRPVGWATLGAGAIFVGTGAALLAIDGQPVARRCDGPPAIDPDGDCRWLHQTMGAGAVLTIAGIAAVTAGVTILVVDARHRRTRDLDLDLDPSLEPQVRVGLGFNRLELEVRF